MFVLKLRLSLKASFFSTDASKAAGRYWKAPESPMVGPSKAKTNVSESNMKLAQRIGNIMKYDDEWMVDLTIVVVVVSTPPSVYQQCTSMHINTAMLAFLVLVWTAGTSTSVAFSKQWWYVSSVTPVTDLQISKHRGPSLSCGWHARHAKVTWNLRLDTKFMSSSVTYRCQLRPGIKHQKRRWEFSPSPRLVWLV